MAILNTIKTATIGASTQRVAITRYGDGSIEFRPLLVQSGGTTSGNKVITVSSTAGVVVGQSVTGTGVGAGAKVVSFVANTSITVDVNSSATATVTITVDKSVSSVGKRSAPRAFITELFAALAAIN